MADLSRGAAKLPSAAPLSAESQARLNKALKQGEAAQAAAAQLKEQLAAVRSEMLNVNASLAQRLKEALGQRETVPRETAAPAAAAEAAKASNRADKGGAGKAERGAASTAAAKKNARGAAKPEPK